MVLKKSRDIPVQDYYTILQVEYISYFCRYKIYERPEDVKKFEDICKKKRKKIESISLKSSLPSIFDSESSDYKQKYVDKFLNEWGLPNFHYRDEYQAKIKGHWDKVYYFKKNIPVEVNLGETIIKGKVKYLDFKTYNIEIISEENNKKFQHNTHISNVRRIHDQDFLNNFI